jgi:hypothetical protein
VDTSGDNIEVTPELSQYYRDVLLSIPERGAKHNVCDQLNLQYCCNAFRSMRLALATADNGMRQNSDLRCSVSTAVAGVSTLRIIR